MTLSIDGQYFRRGSSTATPAHLVEDDGHCVLTGAEGDILGQYPPNDIHCVYPMADAPWRLEFADGAVFETLDHRHIESWLHQFATPQGSGWIRRMEKSWPWALLGVGLLPLIVFLCVFKLLPWLAEIAAQRVPVAVLDQLDDQVLASLDEHWLKPSKATAQQHNLMQESWAALGQTEGLTLVQRSSPVLGANAIALPGGSILVTDQLLAVVQAKEELIAVLAHEAGHVRANHGVRNIIQTLGAAALIATVVGDVSGVAEMVLVSAPATLQQLQYSREFELAADESALSRLDELGIVRSCLGSGLQRIVTAQKEKRAFWRSGDKEHSSDDTDRQQHDEVAPEWLDYLSTHPNTTERIALSGGLSCP